jgi:rod shape-determining protein MreD
VVIMIIGVIVGALVQTLTPPIIVLGHAKVPCLMALVLYYALNRGADEMIIAGFLCGLVQDLLSPIPLGYSAFLFCAMGLTAGKFRKLVMGESYITPVVFGMASAFALSFLMYFLLIKDGIIQNSFASVWLKAFGTALLAAICTPITFVVTDKLDGLVGNVQTMEPVDDFE